MVFLKLGKKSFRQDHRINKSIVKKRIDKKRNKNIHCFRNDDIGSFLIFLTLILDFLSDFVSLWLISLCFVVWILPFEVYLLFGACVLEFPDRLFDSALSGLEMEITLWQNA